jgi:hypothetical protein
MEPARMLVALVLLSSALAPISRPPAPQAEPAQDAFQLLVNPGLESYDPPYDHYQGIACQVAGGWQRFWLGESRPCWMDTRVFAGSPLGGGWVERIEGETSQMILSTAPYDAGVWQQVGGLVPGTPYGFCAAMLTIFQTSAQDAVHGTMLKQVGIDPTGGTDPLSPDVVWSPPDDHDQGPWDVDSITAAYAQASTVTVFARVNSLYPSGGLPFLNLGFIDSAILAQTATVSAVAPEATSAASFTVRWDNAVPSPGGTIRWYDVQWLDEAEGTWHDWLVWTKETKATFTGTLGHAYRFRARVWQRYPNGAHLFSPYAPEGDARTCVACHAVVWGRVLGHNGLPLAGATVAVSGTGYAVASQVGGAYRLAFPSNTTQAVSLTATSPGWTSPPPLLDVSLAPGESLPMTWTLTLPGDVLVNGDFEHGLLEGWSAGSGVGAVGSPVHTGQGAVLLTAQEGAAGLSQTAVISGAWEPALSFWYRPVVPAAGDALQVTVSLTGSEPPGVESLTSSPPVTATQVLTLSLAAGDWQFFSWQPGPPGAAFSGTATVEFRLLEDGQEPAAAVCLDEVRLAPGPGGPRRLFLPLLGKGY